MDTMMEGVYEPDSIEVLALFAVESPKTTTSSSRASSQSGGASISPNLDGDGDIDDENPSDSSVSDGDDSQDTGDLVSVSLFEADIIENVKPMKPLVPILKNGNGKYMQKLDY
jgi:hypothetical protein